MPARPSSPSLVVRDLKLALSSPSPYARTSRVKLLLRLARAHEACGDVDGAKDNVAELRRMAKEVGKGGNAKEKVIHFIMNLQTDFKPPFLFQLSHNICGTSFWE